MLPLTHLLLHPQTILPQRAVPALMDETPLKKVRHFGGKLGEALQQLGCTTAGELAKASRREVEKVVGADRAR